MIPSVGVIDHASPVIVNFSRANEGAALDRESKKAEPNLRWRGITGACVQGTSHLERVRFLHILAILGHWGLAGVNHKAERFRSG
jgi:hypothetical protein